VRAESLVRSAASPLAPREAGETLILAVILFADFFALILTLVCILVASVLLFRENPDRPRLSNASQFAALLHPRRRLE
jgi:hypothetical protein